MVVLRPTQRLRRHLPVTRGPVAASTTALGDWYVNRLVVDRKPLLLLVSARSLLPILIPARAVAALPERLAGIVGARLQRFGVQSAVIRAEVAEMAPVRVAATADRSVLGIMVDFAKSVPFYLEAGGWDETTLPFVEGRLAETPCFAGAPGDGTVFPDKAAPELLAARWHAA